MSDFMHDVARLAALRAIYEADPDVMAINPLLKSPVHIYADAGFADIALGDGLAACDHEVAEIRTAAGEIVRRYCNLCGEQLRSISTPPTTTWDELSGYVWTSPQRWP